MTAASMRCMRARSAATRAAAPGHVVMTSCDVTVTGCTRYDSPHGRPQSGGEGVCQDKVNVNLIKYDQVGQYKQYCYISGPIVVYIRWAQKSVLRPITS